MQIKTELQKQREESCEYGLPEYLQHDPDAYKEALEHGLNLLDCLWGSCTGATIWRRTAMEL